MECSVSHHQPRASVVDRHMKMVTVQQLEQLSLSALCRISAEAGNPGFNSKRAIINRIIRTFEKHDSYSRLMMRLPSRLEFKFPEDSKKFRKIVDELFEPEDDFVSHTPEMTDAETDDFLRRWS